MDFKKNVSEIEKRIGYTFNDKSLLTQSFTRTSFCNERRHNGYSSNEVLEFFGDSVLSAAIISILLDKKTERYEHGIRTALTEGDFSNIRSKLSDKRNLSKSTAVLGLQGFLIMGEGDAKLGIENEPSVMEDLFESIVGAVYIDCGRDMETVIRVVSGMLDTSVYLDDTPTAASPKNALQEFCQDKNHRLPPPVYKTVGESGPDHRKVFERAVYIGDRQVAVGKGKNQRAADTAAAEAALELLTAEVQNKKVTILGTEVLAKLKALAQENKQPSPEFRDLGEGPKHSERTPEFMVECRLMGKSAVGIGNSKQQARIAAADKLLTELTPKKKKHGEIPHPQKKKPANPKIELSNITAAPSVKGFASTLERGEKIAKKAAPKITGVSHTTAAKKQSHGKGSAKRAKRS